MKNILLVLSCISGIVLIAQDDSYLKKNAQLKPQAATLTGSPTALRLISPKKADVMLPNAQDKKQTDTIGLMRSTKLMPEAK